MNWETVSQAKRNITKDETFRASDARLIGYRNKETDTFLEMPTECPKCGGQEIEFEFSCGLGATFEIGLSCPSCRHSWLVSSA